MELRPDDSRVRVGSPRLQDSQVLESLLTLTDETTVGLQLEDAGAAVPLQAGSSDGQLRPGEPFRLQLISESRVVVLERLNPVEPTGRIAVLRSGERVVMVMRLSNWSSRLGPLQMQFTPGTEFAAEPMVLTERGPLRLVENGGLFESGPEQVKELFGVSEFTVTWSERPVAGRDGMGDERYAWPKVSDRIVWTEALCNAGAATTEISGAVTEDLPEWAGAAAETLGWRISEAALKGGVQIPLETIVQGDQLVLPRFVAVTDKETEGVPGAPQVHAVSMLQLQDGRPTRGTTVLLMLARRYPVQVELEIPDSLVLEQLPTELQPLPRAGKRGRFGLEIKAPLTRLELRWLSRIRGATLFSPEVQLELPHLEGAKADGVLWLSSVGAGAAGIRSPQRLRAREDAVSLLNSQILRSLQSAGLSPVQLGLSGEATAEATRLADELLKATTTEAELAGAGEMWFRLDRGESLKFAVRQRLNLERILTAGIGLLMCAAAVLFAAPDKRSESR
jgi:hypothetical protein